MQQKTETKPLSITIRVNEALFNALQTKANAELSRVSTVARRLLLEGLKRSA